MSAPRQVVSDWIMVEEGSNDKVVQVLNVPVCVCTHGLFHERLAWPHFLVTLFAFELAGQERQPR